MNNPESQLTIINELLFKAKTIIRHPNRNLIDNIVISYILLQKESLENIHTALIASFDSKNEHLISRQLSLNESYLQSIGKDIDNVYDTLVDKE